jgi:hypothetical protein
MKNPAKLMKPTGWIVAAIVLFTLNFSTAAFWFTLNVSTAAQASAQNSCATAAILLNDDFSFGSGIRSGIIAGTKLDDQVVQTGVGTWQNEYGGTNEMNEFVFGTNGVVICTGKTSAHNYVPYDFTLFRTIIAASADFKMSAESKTAGNTLWVVGLWGTVDQPNLWSITNGDIMTARFWPAGSSEGRLQIRGRGNNLIESRSADGVKFSPTDTIRISVSYDKITGEWSATAYNLTSNAPMTSVKYIKPGIIDLHYAGFGITIHDGCNGCAEL